MKKFAHVLLACAALLPLGIHAQTDQKDNPKKTCSDQALDIEMISIERTDAGVLRATVAITNNANIPYKIYPAKPHVVAMLSDDKGETWNFSKHTVGNTYPPGAKIKGTVTFTRSVGGGDAKSATFTLRVALNSNYMNRCSATFNNVAIQE